MKTLRKLIDEIKDVPTGVAWYLSDLGEALGKQKKDKPQK